MHVLSAVLKHVPFGNIFQISMVCSSEKSTFLETVFDWHCANFVVSKAGNNMSFLLVAVEIDLHSLLKQTTKQFGLFAKVFMLQDIAFNM